MQEGFGEPVGGFPQHNDCGRAGAQPGLISLDAGFDPRASQLNNDRVGQPVEPAG